MCALPDGGRSFYDGRPHTGRVFAACPQFSQMTVAVRCIAAGKAVWRVTTASPPKARL